jgi:hypothetical protein
VAEVRLWNGEFVYDIRKGVGETCAMVKIDADPSTRKYTKQKQG